MASAATRTVGKAAVKRMSGSRPGVFAALIAAVVVGIATYRLLRSGD